MQHQGEDSVLNCRKFTASDAPELFALAMKVRTEVFVKEQKVPAENELDHWDSKATHWLLMDGETQQPVATGRMFSNEPGVALAGRMAVCKSTRGKGYGKRLLEEILREAKAQGFNQLVVHAQTHALRFYEVLGFEVEGEEFFEEGISHYLMRKFFT